MTDNGHVEGLSDEERRASKPRIRAQVFDLANLERVDLNDVLNHSDPVIVNSEAGREFIVVAPRYDPEVRRQAIVGPDVGDRQMSLSGFGSSPEPYAGLPGESGNTRIGIGGTSGAIKQHSRVDLAAGIGVSDSDTMGTELGTAVASPWTAWTRREYNADLFGYKGLRVYDKMRKSDGTVRGTMRLAKTPVLAAQWGIKPASDSTRDVNIANFVWDNLCNWMSMSWSQFVTESLLMLDFGYYMFEKVFDYGENVTNDPRARGKVVWKKFAPRHPMDVKEWFFDLNGGPLSVDMWSPPVWPGEATDGQGIPNTFQGGTIQAFSRWINIPISKLLVFSFDKEAGNIEGISILRSAYKHWYFKDNLYKIDAIQKERHGIGIPVVTLPVGYSNDDLKLADQLGRNLRTNDRAHVVLPPLWTLAFAELKGHPVDCIPSIKHHDQMIPQGILGQFMATEKTDIEEQHTIFLKATRFSADIILDTVNKYAIPQLVDYNWIRSVYPQVYAKRIGEQEDWRTQSFTLRNYVGAGIIVPDDALENQIRDEMGLPPVDTATARLVRTPAQTNPQRIQPAPTEEAGPGHIIIPANMPGQPATPAEPPPPQPSQPEQITGPVGLPPGQQQQQGAGIGAQHKQNANIPGPNVPPPTPPRVGLPRQTKPGTVSPSTGKGDNSGTSKRRGQ